MKFLEVLRPTGPPYRCFHRRIEIAAKLERWKVPSASVQECVPRSNKTHALVATDGVDINLGVSQKIICEGEGKC